MPNLSDLNDIRICEWLQAFGIDTWNRIGFSYNRNTLNTHEVTLTENLVYYLYSLGQSVFGNIQIYEALDETANGNDVEIFVNRGGRLLWFPTQAKIVKPKTGRYESISYPVGNPPVQQIKLLHDYASKYSGYGITGFPLYLFYNYINSSDLPSVLRGIDVEEYGTSVVSEKYIYDTFSPFRTSPPKKKWKKIPTFSDFHFSNALPLYKLCSLMQNDMTNLDTLGINEAEISDISTEYNSSIIDTILPESQWKPLISRSGIGRLSNTLSNTSIVPEMNENEEVSFRAKFAIVLSESNTATSLIHMR